MTGNIFNIQKFCTNDGPGIRTTVFLKGCPLRCVWCHNPESQSSATQILFRAEKCTGCGRCVGVDLLSSDFTCYNNAKEVCGKSISTDEVVREVMKDDIFYKNSGGGVTLSGGEPLAQLNFSLEILQKCKENGVHTAIETCGFATEDAIIKIAPLVDLFLFDYKETDPKLHLEFTGVDNAVILRNLRLLNSMGKDIVLRCPLIPGYNMRALHYDGIAQLASSLENVHLIEIEPYHRLGEGKYEALGMDTAKIAPPTDDEIGEIIDYIKARTDAEVRKS